MRDLYYVLGKYFKSKLCERCAPTNVSAEDCGITLGALRPDYFQILFLPRKSCSLDTSNTESTFSSISTITLLLSQSHCGGSSTTLFVITRILSSTEVLLLKPLSLLLPSKQYSDTRLYPAIEARTHYSMVKASSSNILPPGITL